MENAAAKPDSQKVLVIGKLWIVIDLFLCIYW